MTQTLKKAKMLRVPKTLSFSNNTFRGFCVLIGNNGTKLAIISTNFPVISIEWLTDSLLSQTPKKFRLSNRLLPLRLNPRKPRSLRTPRKRLLSRRPQQRPSKVPMNSQPLRTVSRTSPAEVVIVVVVVAVAALSAVTEKLAVVAAVNAVVDAVTESAVVVAVVTVVPVVVAVTESAVEDAVMESAVEVAVATVRVAVDAADPLLREKKVRLPLVVDVVIAVPAVIDSRANPAKTHTPWTDKTVPAVDVVVTAKQVVAVVAGAVIRPPLLMVKRLRVRLRSPLALRRKLRLPLSSKKRRKLVTLSKTSWPRRLPNLRVFWLPRLMSESTRRSRTRSRRRLVKSLHSRLLKRTLHQETCTL